MINQPNILLIGYSGQIGSFLFPLLQSIGNLKVFENSEWIFISFADLEKKLDKIRPNIIVNTLAYTNVNNAENDKEKALFLNATFPEIISNWCFKNQCLLIHYSTDYVFSGKGNIPKKETSKPNPLNFYGLTKLQGETSIRDSGTNSIILRCSWIYSLSHNSFLKTMLAKMKSEEVLRVVNDQIGTPTSARWVAKTTQELITKKMQLNGCTLINCIPSGYCSWYTFSINIFEVLKSKGYQLKTKKIMPITSDTLSQGALRPKNSRLDNSKLNSILNYKVQDWCLLLDEELEKI